MPGVAGLKPARIAQELSVHTRTTPGLIHLYRNLALKSVIRPGF